MFKRIDHLGIATRDIAAAIKVLEKTGPIVLGTEEQVPAFGVKAVMVSVGDGVPVELIEPLGEDSGVAKFLDKRGEGLHHIAYRVADIDAALATCVEQGLRLIDSKPRHGYAGSRVAFVHPKSFLGVLTELVERDAGADEPPYDPA